MSRKGCKICEHAHRKEIESLLLNNYTYRDIVSRYPDINTSNVQRHKVHMFDEVPEKLQDLINRALNDKSLLVDNVSDLVKLLEHQKRYEEKYIHNHEEITKSVDQILREYLCDDVEESVVVRKEEYQLFKEFIKERDPEKYKEIVERENKIKRAT